MNITGNMTMIADFSTSNPTTLSGIISRNYYNPYEIVSQTNFKYQASNASGYTVSTGSAISANTRTFRAVTRDATAGYVNVYKDGIFTSRVAGVKGNMVTSTNPIL